MTKTILLADDSVTIQKVVELTFMDQDYQVIAVSDGRAALSRLSEMRPDLVIADVHMPEANGYEVCKEAKQRYQGLPVLLLVGTFEPFDLQQANAAGADSHLKKPFDSQDLLREVDTLISQAVPAEAAPAYQMPDAGEPATLPPVPAAPPPMAGFATSAPSPAAGRPPLPTAAVPAMPSVSAYREPAPAAPPPEPDIIPPDRGAWEASRPAPPSSFATPEPVLPEPEPVLPEPEPVLPEPEPVLPESEPVFEAELPEPEPVSFEPEAAVSAYEPVFESEDAEEVASRSAEPQYLTADEEPEEASPEPEAPRAAATAAASATAANGDGALSDEDVDRIARRVVQLIGDDVIRQVAWDVVPDLAEVVIKERIKELESQVE